MPDAKSIWRIDCRRKLVPDLHIVAIRILKKDVWLARNELAVLTHLAAGGSNGCHSALDVRGALQPEAEVCDAADLAGLAWLAFKDQYVTAAWCLGLDEVSLCVHRHDAEDRLVEVQRPLRIAHR
jgi:hypothetical protein